MLHFAICNSSICSRLSRQLHLEHGARPLFRDRGRGSGRDGGAPACGRCTVPGRCPASRVPVPAPAARSGRKSSGAGACGMPRPLSAIRTSTWPSPDGRRLTSTRGGAPAYFTALSIRLRKMMSRSIRRPDDDARLQVEPDGVGRHAVVHAHRRRAVAQQRRPAPRLPLRPSGRSASSRPASSIWLIRWSSRSRSSSMKRWKSACNCWLT